MLGVVAYYFLLMNLASCTEYTKDHLTIFGRAILIRSTHDL